MVAANEVSKMVVTDSVAGSLQTQRLAKEGHAELTVEERRKILLKKLKLLGLKSWTEENKETALDLLAKYHDIFTLEDGEMGCTKTPEDQSDRSEIFQRETKKYSIRFSSGGERSPGSHV